MIELSEVSRNYRSGWLRGARTVQAVDRVSLSIAAGTALGIVGLNGAGKSTLLRMLLGYARPASGTISIAGRPPRAYVEREGIAYVPERPTIPRRWTVRGALRAYAMLGNMGVEAWPRVDSAMERLGLAGLADRPVGTLSKGNLQRVGIAQAILGDRALMVLDEPTDGLDPIWIAELRTILGEWRATDPGRVLVIASHTLAEVERVCTRVILLHNGRLEGELHPRGEPGNLETEFLGRIRTLEEARA